MWCLEPNLVSYKASRGAKSVFIGVKQTLVDPPTPTKTPSKPPKNPIIDPPQSQFNPSSYFTTHQQSQNPQPPPKPPKFQIAKKMAKNGNVPPQMGLISVLNIICTLTLCMALISLVTLGVQNCKFTKKIQPSGLMKMSPKVQFKTQKAAKPNQIGSREA